MDKKWVIFDVMGVIFKDGDSINGLLVPYLRNINRNITREKVYDLYLKGSAGKLKSRDIWRKLNVAHIFPKVEKDFLNKCFRLDKSFIKTAKTLKKKYKLAILSNDVLEWSDHLRKKHDLDRFFNVIVISGEVKCRKPQEKIYRIILKKTRAKPENCVFIDDKSRNLIPAAEMGFKTIKFNRNNSKDDFCADFEIDSFVKLPKAIEKVFK